MITKIATNSRTYSPKKTGSLHSFILKNEVCDCKASRITDKL